MNVFDAGTLDALQIRSRVFNKSQQLASSLKHMAYNESTWLSKMAHG